MASAAGSFPGTYECRAIGRAMNVEIMDKLNESEATDARYRILRFDDEIRHHVKHTEEHFNQIMDDIDEYEKKGTNQNQNQIQCAYPAYDFL